MAIERISYRARNLRITPSPTPGWELPGRMATRSCASGAASIIHGQEDEQNSPISNTVDRYSFSNTELPKLPFPLAPFLVYAENGGLGVCLAARSRSQPKGRLCLRAAEAVAERFGNGIVPGQQSHLWEPGEPATGVGPYPAFGPVSWRGNVGNSTFEALQLNA